MNNRRQPPTPHDADFDDYTRAKAAFFDQVQREYEAYRPPASPKMSVTGQTPVAGHHTRLRAAPELKEHP